ncbi:MAG TPA: Gfo/Idh/MocA family oxidoreductase [Gemmataceae bacterium]|nr:Gfo/Idh/MocA family oxidoreductase [Gemmataceae bacterium]
MRPDASQLNRRNFLRTMAVGGLATVSLPRAGIARDGPNDRLALGFIGVGTMGRGHLGSFLGMADVQVTAVCDVVAERRDAAKDAVEKRYADQRAKSGYQGCAAYGDFRDLLARRDIDAVVIAMPDHWHAIPCVLAARAGKHIYCEKPLTRTISEGRRVVTEVARAKVVFQTGSQQRSEFAGKFRTAVDLIRNGRIGKVKTVRVGVGDPAIPCDLPTQEIPAGTDWKMWVGPAAFRGYHEELCPKGVHHHFPAWRKYLEYANGGLADMGAHHFDIAQWALDMDATGPVRIEPPAAADANRGLRFVYATGIEMLHGGPSGATFERTAGTIYVDRDVLRNSPDSILKEPLDAKAVRVYRATNHRRNWVECIRTKKDTICPAEIGHRSASVCLLGNIGYRLRRPLAWDPTRERFVQDAEADALLDPPLRAPWTWA